MDWGDASECKRGCGFHRMKQTGAQGCLGEASWGLSVVLSASLFVLFAPGELEREFFCLPDLLTE